MHARRRERRRRPVPARARHGAAPTARARSTCSPPTWAAWASSRTTRRCACSRCSPAPTCCRPPRQHEVERYFYSSSACVYAADKQTDTDITALKEADAYPAMPEDGYGWEKLFTERMCRHFPEDFGLTTRVARYHNVYGPHGTWDGGREKAPAAICRKVATAAITGEHEIEIWGDGEQTRSFMYIDDCVQGTPDDPRAATAPEPVNLGSSELVSINQLVDIVEDIAGIKLRARVQARRAAGRARPQQRQHPDPRDLRLGAVDLAGRRPREDLPLGLRPGQALARLSGHGSTSMRILVHDYSGHPFQVELSSELARRGHDVTHSYCAAYVSGKGNLDDAGVAGRASRPSAAARSSTSISFVKRIVQELRFGFQLARAGTPAQPDVVMVSNAPIPSMVLLAAYLLAAADPAGCCGTRTCRRSRSQSSRATSSARRSGSWPQVIGPRRALVRPPGRGGRGDRGLVRRRPPGAGAPRRRPR